MRTHLTRDTEEDAIEMAGIYIFLKIWKRISLKYKNVKNKQKYKMHSFVINRLIDIE